jgi:hypothetical protein
VLLRPAARRRTLCTVAGGGVRHSARHWGAVRRVSAGLLTARQGIEKSCQLPPRVAALATACTAPRRAHHCSCWPASTPSSRPQSHRRSPRTSISKAPSSPGPAAPRPLAARRPLAPRRVPAGSRAHWRRYQRQPPTPSSTTTNTNAAIALVAAPRSVARSCIPRSAPPFYSRPGRLLPITPPPIALGL